MQAARASEAGFHEQRRADDARTKAIVKMTVAEIFEGVGVDLTTPDGRKRFGSVLTWAGDAMDGTAVVRKTAFGAMIATFVSGAAFGLWTMLMWLAGITKIKGGG